MTVSPRRGPDKEEGPVRATTASPGTTASPSTTAFLDPATLASATELVRAAFVEAMREHGLLSGTRMAITARAELLITEALEGDETEGLGEGDENTA